MLDLCYGLMKGGVLAGLGVVGMRGVRWQQQCRIVVGVLAQYPNIGLGFKVSSKLQPGICRYRFKFKFKFNFKFGLKLGLGQSISLRQRRQR